MIFSYITKNMQLDSQLLDFFFKIKLDVRNLKPIIPWSRIYMHLYALTCLANCRWCLAPHDFGHYPVGPYNLLLLEVIKYYPLFSFAIWPYELVYAGFLFKILLAFNGSAHFLLSIIWWDELSMLGSCLRISHSPLITCRAGF